MQGIDQFPERCRDNCELAQALSEFNLSALGIAVAKNCKGPEICQSESEVVEVFGIDTESSTLSVKDPRDGEHALELPTVACSNKGIWISLDELIET